MSMHGVVIWYARQEFKAIIWCEDSGAIGMATGATAWRNPMVDVAVGDFVAFRSEMRGGDRLCRDIQIIESQAAPTLSAAVRAKGNAPAASPNRLLHLCSSRD